MLPINQPYNGIFSDSSSSYCMYFFLFLGSPDAFADEPLKDQLMIRLCNTSVLLIYVKLFHGFPKKHIVPHLWLYLV